jgi:hypothetical protein
MVPYMGAQSVNVAIVEEVNGSTKDSVLDPLVVRKVKL